MVVTLHNQLKKESKTFPIPEEQLQERREEKGNVLEVRGEATRVSTGQQELVLGNNGAGKELVSWCC